ncbi:MAG: cation:proton antiporter [Armatimonadota bacterium]|nr:cation:proton antiporter [Armatimonadota bacterium]MDR7448539.1 cation:proton antiporter [Armatimonadota bacterium]MDR7460228.1 cation:proton antiporter [Armatimonadota bacterium]MDR7478948.1 cation:proton antiporter [Armatimonadota bacterium]MDR7488346.1 cation:proton antiporter [Armatimonadota bacterium]
MPEAPVFRDLALVFAAILVGAGVAVLLRQPLFLGYVLGGLLVNPFTPGPGVREVRLFEVFAQIGVVLLMFSIGIEFSLAELRRLGPPATVGAPATMALLILLTVLAGAALGWPPLQATAVGMTISVASTMVAAKLFLERGEIHAPHARLAVATSLAEDLITVGLIVLLPVLAGLDGTAGLLPLLGALGRAVALIVPFYIVAERLAPPVLAWVARRGHMELFLVVALGIAVGTAGLSSALGLSVALGAFLAGLVISESPFTHEILARLLPLRDVFTALFFASVGLLVRPADLFTDLPAVLVLLALILGGKALTRTLVLRAFGYPWAAAGLVSVHLAQTGEFTFVLAQVARTAGLIPPALANAILAASLLSIVATVALSALAHRWIEEPREAPSPAAAGPRSAPRDHVLIIGFGRVGATVGRALDVFGIPYVAVDLDFRVIERLQRRGVPCVFGDAASETVLREAGAASARLAIVAIPDVTRARLALARLRVLRPDLPVLVRSHAPEEHALFHAAGADEVIHPEHEAGLTLIRHAGERLGVPREALRTYLERWRVEEETAAQGDAADGARG